MTIRKSKDFSEFERSVLGSELSFGMAVESLRMTENLSQSLFAKKLKVSKQYLCDVEKGRRLVSPEQAARFAKAFGHPPKVLVQLSLQDAVNAAGLNLCVKVEQAA